MMRAILLAAAVSTLAFPAFADEPKTPEPPEPRETTLFAPPGGVAMAVIYPTDGTAEEIVTAFTTDPAAATAHRLTSSALLVALGSPGACATVTTATTADDVRHRFCFQESTTPGTAEGAIMVRKVAVCLMAGSPREICEERAPANFKRSAEGTARSVLPEVATERGE